MHEVDAHLKQLAVEAQHHPPKSLKRQRALARLVSAIQQSGKLYVPPPGQFTGFCADIYAEAKQRLFCHICEKIDTYDPSREVLQWVNFLLRRRFFIEASRDIMPTIPKGVQHKAIKRLTIDDLERNSPSEVTPSLSQQVIECIEADTEGIFKGTYTCKNPAANFQFLALRILSGYSWKEISSELGIKIPTLSSFYQRCLTRFAPNLREYLSED